jgi:hypothetical protein
MGTTMSPGFDNAEYATPDGDSLAQQYPRFADLIRALTP